MSDRVYRALPFIQAALSGLCAQPREHVIDKLARSAVDIGFAVADLVTAEGAKGAPEDGHAPDGDAQETLRSYVRDLVRQELDALTGPEQTPKPPEG